MDKEIVKVGYMKRVEFEFPINNQDELGDKELDMWVESAGGARAKP